MIMSTEGMIMTAGTTGIMVVTAAAGSTVLMVVVTGLVVVFTAFVTTRASGLMIMTAAYRFGVTKS